MPSSTDPPIQVTSLAEIPDIVSKLKESFNSHKTRDISYRRSLLNSLVRLLHENRDELIVAMVSDLKCKPEAKIEVEHCITAALDALDNLESWTKSSSVSVKLLNKLDGCHVKPQPLGLVLIIGAWNYPLILVIEPLIGALAAGCTCIIKPSEISSNTANGLAKLFPKYFSSSETVAIINGDAQVTQCLLASSHFDKIMYTGSGRIGKLVMSKAAENLTPVLLELGGKSPCIIAKDSDLTIAANRICFGKFLNAGQTCIAPDYILCEKQVIDAFVAELCNTIDGFYRKDPQSSQDYSRIVNEFHFNRLDSYLTTSSLNENDRIVYGAKRDRQTRYFSPTLVRSDDDNSLLYKDEIFGPILPIRAVDSINEAIEYVNKRDRPLALYLFTNDSGIVEDVLNKTTSGGVCINDTVMHYTVSSLPFGGVGASGIGSYHGKASFEAFSHYKSVMWKYQALESINNCVRYPPFTSDKMKWLDWLLFRKAPKQTLTLKTLMMNKQQHPLIEWCLSLDFLNVNTFSSSSFFGIPSAAIKILYFNDKDLFEDEYNQFKEQSKILLNWVLVYNSLKRIIKIIKRTYSCYSPALLHENHLECIAKDVSNGTSFSEHSLNYLLLVLIICVSGSKRSFFIENIQTSLSQSTQIYLMKQIEDNLHLINEDDNTNGNGHNNEQDIHLLNEVKRKDEYIKSLMKQLNAVEELRLENIRLHEALTEQNELNQKLNLLISRSKEQQQQQHSRKYSEEDEEKESRDTTNKSEAKLSQLQSQVRKLEDSIKEIQLSHQTSLNLAEANLNEIKFKYNQLLQQQQQQPLKKEESAIQEQKDILMKYEKLQNEFSAYKESIEREQRLILIAWSEMSTKLSKVAAIAPNRNLSIINL